MQYDLIKDGKIIRSHNFVDIDDVPTELAPNKGKWLKRKTIEPASFDPATQVKTLVKTLTETESIWEYVTRDKTAEELAADFAANTQKFMNEIQRHLDETAQSKGYDSILSAVSYVGSPNQTYDAEGQAALAWRDAVWTYAETELVKAQQGTRSIPTIEQFIAELPEWQ